MAGRAARRGWIFAIGAAVAAAAVTAASLVPLGSGGVAIAQQATQAKSAVIHLSKYGNDAHTAYMAVSLARSLQTSGTPVTLYLDLDGVRLVDKRVPGDFNLRSSESLAEIYDAFVKAGGRVAVCAHCAQAAGLDAQSLRDGARISDVKQTTEIIRRATQVVDY